jgi:hypothetical protein
MKHISILFWLFSFSFLSQAQTTGDSVKISKPKKDTIKIGSILIIKNNKDYSVTNDSDSAKPKKPKKFDSNFLIVDVGFSNWIDNTNYAVGNPNLIGNPATGAFSANDLKLKSGNSTNVNLWIISYKYNLYKQNVSLKTSLGVEWHNLALRGRTSFREDGAAPYGIGGVKTEPYIFRDSISFSKNKLNLKYLSVPLSLAFYSNPLDKRGRKIGGSIGVMYSRLIRQRNKQNSEERGKQRNQDEFGLNENKFSYIGEFGFGKLRFYGIYTPKSIFEKNLNVQQYTVGLRFSNW